MAHKLRKTPEQVFTAWAWEMCSRLRLHRFDRDDYKYKRRTGNTGTGNSGTGNTGNGNTRTGNTGTEDDLEDHVLYVDLDLDVVQLGEAVATKNPLACFVALQLSQTGQGMF